MTAPHTQCQPGCEPARDLVARLRRGATNGVLIPCEDLVEAADRIEEIMGALEMAHEAIKSLPDDAFGYGTVEHVDGSGIAYQYPLQSELLSNIEAVLDDEGSLAMSLEDQK